MKTKEKIEDMYNFIGFLNDGKFMNQDYRDGIMDALSFVLYGGDKLDCIINHFSNKKQPPEVE